MKKKKFQRQVFKLKDDHLWQATPGYKIFVANNGILRFDFPQDWHLKMEAKSIKVYDVEPPLEKCCLQVSFNQLPTTEWNHFPLKELLDRIVEEDDRHIIERDMVVTVERENARLVHCVVKFLDISEQQEAFSRTLIGLGKNVQCLFTFDYWVKDADRLHLVWEEVVRSIQLGLLIPDPTRGFAVNPRLN